MWYEWRRLLSPFQSVARVLAADPLTVVLWNSAMSASLEHFSAAEMMRGRSLLSRLFRISLGFSRPDYESPRLAGLDDLRFTHLGRSVEYRVRSAADRVAKRS